MERKKILEKLVSKSVREQINLKKKSEFWRNQINCSTPPIVWFGDLMAADKPILLTVGINPSWREYHKKKGSDVLLEKNERRLNLFRCDDCTPIIEPSKLMEGYNNYFRNKPYSWFGLWVENKKEPYNVECFINGLDATFYDRKKKEGEYKYRAVHIDLFPFATRSPYSEIKENVEEDIFNSGISEALLKELIAAIDPERIVLCSKTVYAKFCDFGFCKKSPLTCDGQMMLSANGLQKSEAVCARTITLDKYPTLAMSIDLGNPRGFDKASLGLVGRLASELFNK